MSRILAQLDSLLSKAPHLYVHLFILEGASRKWLPATDVLFYLLRDAALFFILALAAFTLRAPLRRTHFHFAFWGWVAGITSITGAQLIFLGLDSRIALFGLRNYIAPLALAYLVLRFRKCVTSGTMPWTVLMYLPVQLLIALIQVNSPKDALINREVGGGEAYLTTANDIVRASGTFTAPAGLTSYLTLALLCLLIAKKPRGGQAEFLVKLALPLCLVTTLLISGSRGAIFYSLVLVAAWIAWRFATRPAVAMRDTVASAVLVTLLLLALMRAAPDVISAFTQRFENAGQNEDTLARIVDGAFGFLKQPTAALGNGVGMHASSGVALGSGVDFIEVDLRRWVAELGWLGVALATLRVTVGFALVVDAIAAREGRDLTRWLTSIYLAALLISGSITTNPSTQGAFALGLTLLLCHRHATVPRAQLLESR